MAEGTVQEQQRIDIAGLLQKPSRKFAANLLFWTFFIVTLDGFDFAAISFAAPDLMKEWHLSPQTFGVIFSAGTIGMMLGAPIFGYIGDKIGRRKSLFFSTMCVGITTGATVLANSLEVLLILRFVNGIAIGGVLPGSIVLVSEYAPKGSGVKWVSGMFTGYSVGGIAGALLASWLLPLYGWQSIFVVGGILPIVAGGLGYLMLPESIRFLALKPENRGEIVKIAAKLQPGLLIDPDAEFVMLDEKKDKKQQGKYSFKLLFAGVLALITPLIWSFYIINSVALYFLKAWFPVLFVSGGLTPAQAALATAWFSTGGMIGGLSVGWVMDKYGMVYGTIYPLAGAVVTAFLGFTSGLGLMVMVFLCGLTVVGTQYILTACTPLFYPTEYRTQADGAALGIGKIGAVLGPALGGLLVALQLPTQTVFFVVAIPVILGAMLCFFLTRMYKRHYTNAGE
ncbi:MAG: hypothetical protein K0R22_3383 [Sporomusa sp.]|jgi:AAHS family 4-hydroxybenzoate transporter-like MFS transporter|nr:hypothetical protein [Sporomusa sp.]